MNIINLILFGTYDRKNLKPIKAVAAEVNYKLLIGSAITCITLLVLPLLEIIVFSELSYRFYFYSTFLVITCCVFIATVMFAKKHQAIILPLFYVLFITCLVYGCWLGIWNSPENTGVTFHIVVFVFPLLIVDVPWRCDIIIISSCITYTVSSYMNKSQGVYHIEFMNAMNSMLLSLVISTIRQVQNVKSLTDRVMLKKQRDTDILSRTLSRQALETGIKKLLEKEDTGGCLIFVDLDDFKHVNDTYGHIVGDDLIVATGECLRNICRSTDIVGRYGGDEFMLFFPGVIERSFVEKKAQEILTSVNACKLSEKIKEKLTVSIGCLIFKSSNKNLVSLFSEVDNLLYEAKHKGKNQFCIKELS